MNTPTTRAPWVVAVLLVALAAPAFAAAPGGPYWALEFENDTPKQLVLEGQKAKLAFYWYVVYRVRNPSDQEIPARLRLSLKLSLEKVVNEYDDLFDTTAEEYLEKKVVERPLCNWAELRATPLKAGEKREGVALFRVGTEAPDFDTMVVSVRGLAQLRPLGREGNTRKYRQRVLLLKYKFVPSKWRAGKELKYVPEEWTLEDVAIADRTSAEGDASDAMGKRLQELLKKAKEAREKKPAGEAKPPPKSSARPEGGPLLGAGPASGKPAPQLVEALRKRAAAHPYVRAAFRETTGRGQRQAEVAGTVVCGREGKFAAERILTVRAERTIKERRVFDGDSLWIHTTARGAGDTVRRWKSAATRQEWRTVDGRPEVDFATVVNPVRAWCLFAGSLVYMGAERLGSESAYVFEARPGEAFKTVLTGPLSSELLAEAAGRRVRFWLGAKSAFQLKMEVYDRRGNTIGRLECSDVTPDAVVSPQRLAFKPPAGVDVIDMNAAVADGHPAADEPAP